MGWKPTDADPDIFTPDGQNSITSPAVNCRTGQISRGNNKFVLRVYPSQFEDHLRCKPQITKEQWEEACRAWGLKEHIRETKKSSIFYSDETPDTGFITWWDESEPLAHLPVSVLWHEYRGPFSLPDEFIGSPNRLQQVFLDVLKPRLKTLQIP
jgi:hypothetical protein